ncbi:MAG TPA: translation initiation factor IF-2 N-terminal domain-containing protein, partial [Desulfitobacteriaceae bacterium]|nr:translation initiation factor IF-2 N-terminal domain-containing protein [Desulfitobacteriaceae bacterium]
MTNSRVHELAKELNISSKDVMANLEALGVEVKNHLSTVEKADADRLRSRISETKGGEPIVEKPEPHTLAPGRSDIPRESGPEKSRAGEPPITSPAAPAPHPGLEGRPPGARPPMEGRPPGARPPMEGRPPGARPPMEGRPPGVRPPMEGRPPGARPPMEGRPPGTRPPMEGRPPGARPPMEGRPPGARPPMEGRPPGA